MLEAYAYINQNFVEPDINSYYLNRHVGKLRF
jgi:hypothetical protein